MPSLTVSVWICACVYARHVYLCVCMYAVDKCAAWPASTDPQSWRVSSCGTRSRGSADRSASTGLASPRPRSFSTWRRCSWGPWPCRRQQQSGRRWSQAALHTLNMVGMYMSACVCVNMRFGYQPLHLTPVSYNRYNQHIAVTTNETFLQTRGAICRRGSVQTV